MMNLVTMNLELAEKSMKTNDFKMAMIYLQDARKSLTALRIQMIPVDYQTDCVINRLSKSH